MAWSVQVTNKTQDESGRVFATLEFTDGVKTITETYRNFAPPPDWLKNTARNRIAQLEVADAFDVPTGPLVPADPITPDPDKDLFLRRVRVLPYIETLVNLGALQPDNPQLVALINWVKNNFNEYIGDLTG